MVDSCAHSRKTLAQSTQVMVYQSHRGGALAAHQRTQAPRELERVGVTASHFRTLCHELGDFPIRMHDEKNALL